MEIDLSEPTKTQIAAVLGISSRWVGELRAKGDLPSDGASLKENIDAWVARATEADGKPSFDAERARLVKEQADKIAMLNARERQELASLPDMTMAVIGLIEMSKARLVRVPSIVAKGDEPLRLRIETAIADALDELSAARVQETTGGGLDEDVPEGENEDEDAASATEAPTAPGARRGDRRSGA